MKVIHNQEQIQNKLFNSENLLKNKNLSACDSTGKEVRIEGKKGGHHDQQFIKLITDDTSPLHIDLFSSDFTLSSDVSLFPIEVDSFLLRGYPAGRDFSLREFDLYFSNGDKPLFSEENLYYHYCNTDEFDTRNKSNSTDVLLEFDKPIKAKKFGLKISKPNPTDDISRISFLGLFSKKFSHMHSDLIKFTGDASLKLNATANGERLNMQILQDGLAFSDSFVDLEPCELVVTPVSPIKNGYSFLAYTGDNPAKLFAVKPNDIIDFGNNEYIVKFSFESESFSVKTNSSIKLHQIGVNNNDREALIDANRVINDNFYGFGANVIPTNTMPESIERGFNMPMFYEEERRIMLSKPIVVRLWFQPDWFIIDEETYKNGIYDYDSVKMKAFFQYMDAFRKAGCDIELDYGWKVDKQVWDWYCIPEVEAKQESAPKDINLFAKSCADFINELCINRGYTNVKYLTFYNEPNCGDFKVKHDYNSFNDIPKMEYWFNMSTAVKNELSLRGLNKYVSLWGPESSGMDEAKKFWAKYFLEKDESLLSVHTMHRYHMHTEDTKVFSEFALSITNGKPVVISEFNCLQRDMSIWNYNLVDMMIAYANSGIAGALIWLLNGAAISLPLNFVCSGHDDLWQYLPNKIDKAELYFPIYSLFTQYVPAHSKTIYSVTVEKDLHIVAFETADSDYTVIVDANKCEDIRNLDVKFNKNINKKFYKTVVIAGETSGVEPYLAPAEEIGTISNKIADKLPKQRCVIAYSTIKPVEQLIASKKYVELKPGEEVTVTNKLVNCRKESPEIVYSIKSGEEFIELCGNKIKAKASAKPEDYAAVEITAKDCSNTCYDIVLVKII